jgi:signal-transduction protein with cAMP-binding, CBS, and nucleotidyltransferase domain
MKTAEQILQDKETDLISVTPETPITEALRLMIKNHIGAILIKDKEIIVGIWTERDLMRNTVSAGFDPQTAQIGDYMTTSLPSAPHTDTVYQLLDKFLGMRLRHLLIQKNGDYIGLLSTGDVIKASLQEKDQELKALNAIVSWEYYENWQWRKKRSS